MNSSDNVIVLYCVFIVPECSGAGGWLGAEGSMRKVVSVRIEGGSDAMAAGGRRGREKEWVHHGDTESTERRAEFGAFSFCALLVEFSGISWNWR